MLGKLLSSVAVAGVSSPGRRGSTVEPVCCSAFPACWKHPASVITNGVSSKAVRNRNRIDVSLSFDICNIHSIHQSAVQSKNKDQ